MDRSNRRLTKAAVAGVVLLGAGAAGAAEPSVEELKAQVQELNKKVAALETKQATSSPDAQATIEAVLRDAERRTHLLANGADLSAGYDTTFFIRAGDAFLLRPQINFQFRNITDFRQNTSGNKDDEIENGFEVRRLQFILEGNIISKDIEYAFVWNTNRETSTQTVRDSTGAAIGTVDVKSGGNLFLEDAYVKYMFADQWGTRIGQFKDPVTHEKLVSDKRLVTVERSMLDAILGGGYEERVQGVTAIFGGYKANQPLYVEAGITDGINSLNTDFTKHSSDFGVAGRIEYKVMGEWKDYRDFTAKGDKGDLLVIGGGFDWTQFGDGNSEVGTVDAQWEMASGLGLYGAVIVRQLDAELTGAADDQTDYGALVQVSYLLNPAWEVFGRYDFVKFDTDRVFGTVTEDTFHEITGGVTYYMGDNGSAGHRMKITVDLNWLPNGAPQSLKGLGYIGDTGGDD
ncbi:MAG TPA: porin, partial [Tepidisphaeraceae bacterium]|nr:porin [Tepidisphaeraceae bacterium]